MSVRLKLTLSYAGFLMIAGALILAAAWVFLLRGYPVSSLVPRLSNLPRAFDPTNFGPGVFGTAAVLGPGLPPGVRSRRGMAARRSHAVTPATDL